MLEEKLSKMAFLMHEPVKTKICKTQSSYLAESERDEQTYRDTG